MANVGNWTILGQDDLAGRLEQAAAHIDVEGPVTLATEGRELPGGAVATGRAVLQEGANTVIPHLLGFRAFEQAARMVQTGDLGRPYACFGSYRLGRNTSPETVRDEALLPLLSYAASVFASDVQRVWAKNASLFWDRDAWFVTIRLRDETLITLEALPAVTTGATPELLVELTGSERVIRAEPARQAVTVERSNGPAQRHPWWEDEAERLLQLVRDGELLSDSASMLREAWSAINHSSESGRPAGV